MTPLSTIADRLRSLRSREGLSVRAFAQALRDRGSYETSRSSVSQYENNTRVPAEYARAVCAAFGVRPDWLLLGEGLPTWVEEPVLERTLARIASLIEEVRPFPAEVQSQLENFFELMPELFGILDEEGRILRVNQAAVHALGYPRKELATSSVHALAHPDDADLARTLFLLEETGEPRRTELRIRRKDGTYLWLSCVTLVAGGFVYAAARNLTREKAAETRARLFEAAIEQGGDCVILTTADGVILYVNPAFTVTTGYTAEDAASQTPRLLRSGHHLPAFYEDLWDTILAGRIFRATFVNRKKNGKLYCDARTISPVRDTSGAITHFVATGREVKGLAPGDVRRGPQGPSDRSA